MREQLSLDGPLDEFGSDFIRTCWAVEVHETTRCGRLWS